MTTTTTPAQANPFDSDICARIPISFITSVQPHGYLVVVDREQQHILQVSQNLPQTLGLVAADLVGKPLAQFVMAQTLEEIREQATSEGVNQHIPTHLFFSSRSRTINCLAVMHVLEQYLILELEEHKVQAHAPTFVTVYQQVKQILGSLKKTDDTNEMLQIAADEIKLFSGFDRIMIYQFDDDWNGTVTAEALEPGLDPYLHLRFPASDIPKQARDLYLRTPYRCIPDAQYVPSPLVPELNPVTNSATDLSDCSLRGVPPVHIEYLFNMGVRASMSTAIIKDNKLWGLISCHHRSEKYLPYELRSAFELLANIISAQLSARENNWVMVRKTELMTQHAQLLEQMSSGNDFVKGLTSGKASILNYLNLTGAALLNEGELTLLGETPDKEQLTELVAWLTEQQTESIFATDSLPKAFEPAIAYKEKASGLIALPLSTNQSAWLLGFRPEVIEQVKWGGNPHDHVKVTQEHGVTTLHPRNSFSLWKETVRFTAKPWLSFELEAAQTLRNSILEVILKIQILKRMVAEEEVYKLSIVASKTDNAVVILNHSGNVEWINQAFTKYTGVDLKEAVGKNLQELTRTSKNLEEVGEIISKSAYNSTSFSKDISIERDNKRYYINFNFTPISNPQQEFDQYIAIGSDITQMREHAEQLEAVNKELDKFAYIIAHDLKAPLRSAESLVDAISGNFEDANHADTPQLLQYLKRSVKRMSHLITEVLSYSRVGRVNMKQEPVNMKQVLADVVEWLNPPASVQINIQPDIPVIQSVKVDMQQIFSNLIGNALKYACGDNCKIEIGYDALGNDHLFYVRDNGPGIAHENHNRIFEMFQTANSGNAHHSEISTGIGLATVKKLIEEKGGRIWVESEPGHGAVFKFLLPVFVEQEVAQKTTPV